MSGRIDEDFDTEYGEGATRGEGAGARGESEAAARRQQRPGQARRRREPAAGRTMLDEVLARARGIGEGSAEFASNIGATVRDNPIPMALLAAGVASLIASERMGTRGARADARGRLSDWDDDDEDEGRTRALMARARSTAGSLGERARSTSARLGERMRGSATQARDTGARTLQEQPLLTAGLGLVIGAALGAALPLSERERRTLGPARERVLERAREVAREGADRVRESADRVREGAERVRGMAERAAAPRKASGSSSRREEADDVEDAETDDPMES